MKKVEKSILVLKEQGKEVADITASGLPDKLIAAQTKLSALKKQKLK